MSSAQLRVKYNALTSTKCVILVGVYWDKTPAKEMLRNLAEIGQPVRRNHQMC